MASTNVSAIIVAAGSGSRMGGNVNKQLMKLCEVPVFMHSVLTFCTLPQVSEIIIVTRKQDIPRMKEALAEYIVTKPVTFVVGGAARQDSVLHGVNACDDEAAEYIAVHDGARPLVSADEVKRVIEDAQKYGASTLGVAVKDTIKLADKNGFISETPNRSYLYSIQTPQVFRKSLYLDGVSNAVKNGNVFTDDCQLLEAMGVQVYITRGSYKNIKITTSEDVLSAESLLQNMLKGL